MAPFVVFKARFPLEPHMSTPMPPQAASTGSAVTIEITSNGDGTFTVGMCDQPSSDSDSSQQVTDIGQALAMAKHLLMNPPADTDDASGDGSQGAGGDPSNGATQGQGTDAQTMWNQMAQENQSAPTH
jgi:hypothetical protein